MAWTKEQQLAIDIRDKNILVSAAAGSGKTAVLSERVVSRVIEEHIDIDRFLIVTFTNAAAGEMKERIATKLAAAAIDHDEHLERQLSLLSKASISTIHSFCFKLIKTYFTQLNIEPNIKIGNDVELELLREELVEEVLEAAYDSERESFRTVAETFGTVRGLRPIASIVLDLYKFAQSTIYPKQWLEQKVSLLKNATLGSTHWEATILKDVKEELEELENLALIASAICSEDDGPMHYAEAIHSDIQIIRSIDTTNIDNLGKSLEKIKFMKLSTKRPKVDATLKAQAKALRDFIKKRLTTMKDKYTDDKMMEYTSKTGELLAEIVMLVNEFEVKYSQSKKEKGVVDYNDLEHLALKLLLDENNQYTDIAKELAKYYKEVYIDEYQDINNVQETILTAVASTQFMVGDMKQSIYKFRLANPQIFSHKYNTFKPAPYDNADVYVDLSKNFRSRENIINVCNDIFNFLMSEEVGELEYDEKAELKFGAQYPDFNDDCNPFYKEESVSKLDYAQLHIIDTNSDDDIDNKSAEAKMVAKLIKDTLDSKRPIFDNGHYRPVECRDIVILLRAKSEALLFEEELSRIGISAYAEVGLEFFKATEVQLMYNFLKIIDNPMQDIPFIAVLRSTLVGLSFDELAQIRQVDLECNFYTAFVKYLQLNSNPKLDKFANLLEQLRILSSTVSVLELVANLYSVTGYYRYVGMLTDGAYRQANLRLLKLEAQKFEAGLFAFLKYLEQATRLEQAKLVGEDDNVVKIMSIHKSKGLEFPIVFLSQANKQFNTTDLRDVVLMHNELGLATKYKEGYISYNTLPYLALSNAIKSENTSEEMRILYVALTRAKEQLIVTGTINDVQKSIDKLAAFSDLPKDDKKLIIKDMNNYLSWILFSLISHKEFSEQTMLDLCVAYHGKANWLFRTWKSSDFYMDDEVETITQKVDEVLLQNTNVQYGNMKSVIYDKLNYVYPYESATTLPHKIAVTKLKDNILAQMNELRVSVDSIDATMVTHESQLQVNMKNVNKINYIPKFISGQDKLSGASRGTLIHSVFEKLDYINNTNKASIKAHLEQLVSKNQLSSQAVDIINLNKLVSFANSPVINAMRKSQVYFKEQPFVYLREASIINKDCANENILIQGMVDACFIDNGNIVLIDYKSDYVAPEVGVDALVDKYKIQLDLYAEALENIMAKPVISKWLYLYSVDTWVEIN
ncbi:MAG: helicase-exonuclease AddAB subunit AddA [Epulopiscium sp. Nuni2H_MBin001]|nr:MAG: helicase-exonuclease AddAB subunit AddA [Epulopiscium sp. Nuni2H_MBin001]